jgi:hypothetical protein
MQRKWMVLSLIIALAGVCHAQGTQFDPTVGTSGSYASVYHSGNGTTTDAGGEIGGYSSQTVYSGDTVSVSLTLNGTITITPSFGGGGSLQVQYSVDNGRTWATGVGFGDSGTTITYTNTSAGFSLPATAVNNLGNLDNLQFRLYATASGSPSGSCQSTGTLTGGVVTYN